MANNKMPIAWHKTNLENMKQHRDRIALDLERRQLDLKRQEADIAFLVYQTETAEKEGKESFDSSKFLLKRKKR
jgi:hypothetical protein